MYLMWYSVQVREQEAEGSSGNTIEADAVFSPDSDPSTHVLPPDFHFSASSQSTNSYTTEDTPPSFMHDTTQAPEPAEEPPIDPLDPEFIAKTIADSNIYEELYNEFGMGEQFEPDSDDEPDGEGSGTEVRALGLCFFFNCKAVYMCYCASSRGVPVHALA